MVDLLSPGEGRYRVLSVSSRSVVRSYYEELQKINFEVRNYRSDFECAKSPLTPEKNACFVLLWHIVTSRDIFAPTERTPAQIDLNGVP